MVRVISLVPSATETLLAWGLEPVGVTRFCEQGTRFPTFGGTKDPHLQAILAAAPDLVIMCDQENRSEDAQALTASGLAVHALHITHVSQVEEEMMRLAEALGLDRSLGAACGIGQLDEPLAPRDSSGVFVPIWRKPWMTINNDTYGGSLLQTAGFNNIFRAHTDRYPSIESGEILAGNPDFVLAPSEPYPFTERQRAELEVFAPVQFVDGKDLFWWGVRTPAAVRRLRALPVQRRT
jgi:ABC-type Fe3+-hydroxamate transport system substrate-binding protein